MKYFKIIALTVATLSFLASCSPDNQGTKYTQINDASTQVLETSVVSLAAPTDAKPYSEDTEDLISELLSKYVANGLVDYKSWLTNSSHRLHLTKVLQSMSITDITGFTNDEKKAFYICLLYTSPSPRDATLSRMPSSA